MKLKVTAVAKFRLPSRRRSMIGFLCVTSRMTSATSATTAMIRADEDRTRGEPVILFALIEHILQEADANDDEADAHIVDAEADFTMFLRYAGSCTTR